MLIRLFIKSDIYSYRHYPGWIRGCKADLLLHPIAELLFAGKAVPFTF